MYSNNYANISDDDDITVTPTCIDWLIWARYNLDENLSSF